MSNVHLFTSAAFNYIPKVRMLFDSVRKHHPEWRLHLVLADEIKADAHLNDEPFDEIIPFSELDIPNWRGWAFCHNIVELATAIKPFMLARLLARSDCEKVIYLDPDIVCFSRLDDIVAALDNANLVLTPHQTTPEASLTAVMDNEICSLKHGIYNLGFIGVAATDVGRSFASWWSQRLYHFCRADIPNGLFTDQRWIDLVPAFFNDVAIMRSSRHNVATWNLTTRELSLSDSGAYLVDGDPLGFYHFTGFDSGDHRIMARKNGGDNPAVHRLVDWYAAETKSLAQDPLAKAPWTYGSYTDGTPIDATQRLVYRERNDLQRAFPDPFDASTYLAWWNARAAIEYPALLDANSRNAAISKITGVLTPGFRGGTYDLDWGKLGGIFERVLSQPHYGLTLGKRGWEVLKNEGISGLKRRLVG